MSLSRIARLSRVSPIRSHLGSYAVPALRMISTTADSGRSSSDTSVARRDDRGGAVTRRGARATDLISDLEHDVSQMVNSMMAPFQSFSPMRGFSPFFDTLVPRRGRGFLDFESLLSRPVTVHMEEKDNEYILTIQAPGLKKDELDISVNNDFLTISGEHKERDTRRGRQSEMYVSFQRSIALAEDVDQDGVRAEYDDKGNLCRVHLPKKQGTEHKKGKIKIESANEQSSGNQSETQAKA